MSGGKREPVVRVGFLSLAKEFGFHFKCDGKNYRGVTYLFKRSASCLVENRLRAWKNQQDDQARG